LPWDQIQDYAIYVVVLSQTKMETPEQKFTANFLGFICIMHNMPLILFV
jgi:hypothetical protein